MLRHRFNDRVSMISMVGLGNVGFGGGAGRNAPIVNHSTFLDAAEGTIVGLDKARDARARPRAGLRVIKEF